MKSKRVTILFILLILFNLAGFSQTEYKVFRYANDSIASEGTLRDGKPDGYWKTYYENGRLKSEGNRVNHLLEGLWIFYSEEGDTTLAVHYHNDMKNGLRRVYLSDEIQEDQPEPPLRPPLPSAASDPHQGRLRTRHLSGVRHHWQIN